MAQVQLESMIRRRRLITRVAAVGAGGILATGASGERASAPAVTPGASVVAPLLLQSSIDIRGVGCRVPATWKTTLPAGAFGGRVRRPAVGAKSADAHVTAVAVRGTAVTI